MKIEYLYLPLVTLFLLIFGFISLVNPHKVQATLLRFGMNKMQKEIMGEKAHLIFLRILGAVNIVVGILILCGFIKMLIT